MKVSVYGKKTIRKYKLYKGLKIYPSRRAAFRAAKRDARIPMSQHPDEVVHPNTSLGNDYGLDERNARLYIFNLVIVGVSFEFHIREDKRAFYTDGGDQSPHFNSGEPPDKLNNHHYWDDDDD